MLDQVLYHQSTIDRAISVHSLDSAVLETLPKAGERVLATGVQSVSTKRDRKADLLDSDFSEASLTRSQDLSDEPLLGLFKDV